MSVAWPSGLRRWFNIVKRYNALKCALPEKWTQTIQTKIYTRTEKIVIDINVNMNSKLVDFKMCTSKQLYWLVIEKNVSTSKIYRKMDRYISNR